MQRSAGGYTEATWPATRPMITGYLLRLFRAESGGLGVAWAVLSDSYKVIYNLDALMVILDGIRQAGTDGAFDGLDLTERRLYARLSRPGLSTCFTIPLLTRS